MRMEIQLVLLGDCKSLERWLDLMRSLPDCLEEGRLRSYADSPVPIVLPEGMLAFIVVAEARVRRAG